MGCFNGTCGLTQLPIRHGDKIVLFLIKKTSGYRSDRVAAGFCYPHDLYAPIAFPVFGEYNDYGGIENVSKNGELVFQQFADFLQHPLAKVEITKDKFSEAPKNIEELINNDIGRGAYLDVGYMMVLEDVYHEVLNKASKEKNWEGERLSAQWRQSMDDFVADLDYAHYDAEQAKERKQALRELLLSGKMTDTEHQEYKIHQLFMFGYFSTDDFSQYRFLRPFSSDGYYRTFSPFILQLAKTNDSNLKQQFLDFLLFKHVLDASRKSWMPQSGAGSQDSDTDYHKTIARAVLQIIRDRREEED